MGFNKIWHDPVLSKVIAVIILSLGGMIWSFFWDITPFLPVCVVIAVLVVFSLLIYRLKKRPSDYAKALHATAKGFQNEIVAGRMAYVRKELDRGEEGYRNFVDKINYQRVRKPELISADEKMLTQKQIESLGRYRDRERELEAFVDHIVANKADFETRPKDAITGFIHRLEKQSGAIERLIISLEKQ